MASPLRSKGQALLQCPQGRFRTLKEGFNCGYLTITTILLKNTNACPKVFEQHVTKRNEPLLNVFHSQPKLSVLRFKSFFTFLKKFLVDNQLKNYINGSTRIKQVFYEKSQ